MVPRNFRGLSALIALPFVFVIIYLTFPEETRWRAIKIAGICVAIAGPLGFGSFMLLAKMQRNQSGPK